VALPVKTPGEGSRIYTTTWDANAAAAGHRLPSPGQPQKEFAGAPLNLQQIDRRR